MSQVSSVKETSHRYDCPYQLSSEKLTIEARLDNETSTLALLAGTPGQNNGTIDIVGNKQVHIEGGKDGKSKALAGDCALNLLHGNVTYLAQVVLSDEAVQLRKGIPVGGLDNSVRVTDDAIELNCGLGSIKMTKLDITLKCGPSAIKLSPQGVEVDGINLSLAAKLLLKLESTMTQADAKAVAKYGAVFNKIG